MPQYEAHSIQQRAKKSVSSSACPVALRFRLSMGSGNIIELRTSIGVGARASIDGLAYGSRKQCTKAQAWRRSFEVPFGGSIGVDTPDCVAALGDRVLQKREVAKDLCFSAKEQLVAFFFAKRV